MLILEGIPLFLVEIGIGQKMRLGSLGVWNTVHPWLGGVGIASCVVTFFVALYYNVIITWVFFYFFNSFQVGLQGEISYLYLSSEFTDVVLETSLPKSLTVVSGVTRYWLNWGKEELPKNEFLWFSQKFLYVGIPTYSCT